MLLIRMVGNNFRKIDSIKCKENILVTSIRFYARKVKIDPKIIEIADKLPKKFIDSKFHPKGIVFGKNDRYNVAKSILSMEGRPMPRYSEIPGQKPEDLLMKYFLANKPKTRNEIWTDLKNDGFLRSKTYLTKLLRQLVSKKFIITFCEKRKQPFKYRFNIEKSKFWVYYVKSVIEERKVFLKEHQKTIVKHETVIITDQKELNEKKSIKEAQFENIETDLIKNDKDLQEKEKRLENEDFGAKKNINLNKNKIKDELYDRNERWNKIIWSGVGFVRKKERERRDGSNYMNRKIKVENILGKTGPVPQNRKRMLKFVRKKNEDFEKIRNYLKKIEK